MGAISTTIKVNDGISRVMQHMNTALNLVINSFEAMQDVSSRPIDVAVLQAAREELAGVSIALEEAQGQSVQAVEAQREYTKELGNSTKEANGLIGAVQKVVATYATLQTAKAAIRTADEWTQTSARLNMLARDGEKVEEVQQKIFESANRARASYSETADIVSKIGLRAGNAFGSTDEIIAFSETLNKMYAIAGTSSQEQASSMLQLTQALGAGVLRGEEFNAVFEAAPNIMQAIADYMGVPLGALRDLAAQGQISADIVRRAILGASEAVSQDFEAMPATFGQAFNLFKNNALMALEPVWKKLGEISSSDGFLALASGAGAALAVVASIAVKALDVMAGAARFVAENWEFLAPIIGGVAAAVIAYTGALAIYNRAQAFSNGLMKLAAFHKSVLAAREAMATGAAFKATAAQHGFNAALLACPLTWIVLAIIAVIAAIYLICAALNKAGITSVSATGIIVGAFAVAGAYIGNLFFGLADIALGVVNAILNPFNYLANFLANLFIDPVGAILHLFGDLADGTLAILEKIASAIDFVFGSNLADTISGWRGGLGAKVDGLAEKYGSGKYKRVSENLDLSMESFGVERFDYKEAWGKGYAKGEEWGDKLSGLFNKGGPGDALTDYNDLLEEVNGGVAETAANTGKALDISDENLKYMRDLAEQEAVNRFTTAEIKVDMVNNNSVSSGMDLDGMVDYLATGVQGAMEQAAEGVHR